jgi:hypothetical protein
VKWSATRRSVGGKSEQIVGLTLARGPTDATETVAVPRKSLMIREFKRADPAKNWDARGAGGETKLIRLGGAGLI